MSASSIVDGSMSMMRCKYHASTAPFIAIDTAHKQKQKPTLKRCAFQRELKWEPFGWRFGQSPILSNKTPTSNKAKTNTKNKALHLPPQATVGDVFLTTVKTLPSTRHRPYKTRKNKKKTHN